MSDSDWEFVPELVCRDDPVDAISQGEAGLTLIEASTDSIPQSSAPLESASTPAASSPSDLPGDNSTSQVSNPSSIGIAGSGTPVRYYAVWQLPGYPELAGVHHGPYPDCWNGLVALAAGSDTGNQAPFRHRRFRTLEAAVVGFEKEAIKHGVFQSPVSIHVW